MKQSINNMLRYLATSILLMVSVGANAQQSASAQETYDATLAILYLNSVVYTHPILKKPMMKCIENGENLMTKTSEEGIKKANTLMKKSERDQQITDFNNAKMSIPLWARDACVARWWMMLDYYGLPGLLSQGILTQAAAKSFLDDMTANFYKIVAMSLMYPHGQQFIDNGPWFVDPKTLTDTASQISEGMALNEDGARKIQREAASMARQINQMSRNRMIQKFDESVKLASAYQNYPIALLLVDSKNAWSDIISSFESITKKKLTEQAIADLYNYALITSKNMGCRPQKDSKDFLVAMCAR